MCIFQKGYCTLPAFADPQTAIVLWSVANNKYQAPEKSPVYLLLNIQAKKLRLVYHTQTADRSLEVNIPVKQPCHLMKR